MLEMWYLQKMLGVRSKIILLQLNLLNSNLLNRNQKRKMKCKEMDNQISRLMPLKISQISKVSKNR